MMKEILSIVPFDRLGHRAAGFLCAAKHISMTLKKRHHVQILETGTARIVDNWEGDGQSTLVWDKIAQINQDRVSVLSIDCNPEAIDAAWTQTNFVEYRGGDSLTALRSLSAKILAETYLVYLDSMDWHESLNLDSAFHALSELAVIYHALPSGCMVMVDDAHGPNAGKHWMVEMFFAKQQITPVRKHYQFSWIIP